MTRRILSTLLATIVLLAGTVAFPVGASADGDDEQYYAAAFLAPEAAPLSSPLELALLDLTNRDRALQGLQPVDLDVSLLEVARTRASAQLTSGPLNHYDPSGQLAFVGLISQTGVEYLLAGENLARSSGVAADPMLPARVESALMQSPTHRQNILEPSFNRLAIGAAVDGSGRVAFAQIFRAAP